MVILPKSSPGLTMCSLQQKENREDISILIADKDLKVSTWPIEVYFYLKFNMDLNNLALVKYTLSDWKVMRQRTIYLE